MEQLRQLIAIRDEAIKRLKDNPDFKLITSLDAVIVQIQSALNENPTSMDQAVSNEINTPPPAPTIDPVTIQETAAVSERPDIPGLEQIIKSLN